MKALFPTLGRFSKAQPIATGRGRKSLPMLPARKPSHGFGTTPIRTLRASLSSCQRPRVADVGASSRTLPASTKRSGLSVPKKCEEKAGHFPAIVYFPSHATHRHHADARAANRASPLVHHREAHRAKACGFSLRWNRARNLPASEKVKKEIDNRARIE